MTFSGCIDVTLNFEEKFMIKLLTSDPFKWRPRATISLNCRDLIVHNGCDLTVLIRR